MKYLTLFLFLGLISCKDNNPDKIEKIAFVTSGCLGVCPIFEIDVAANREAEFYAQAFNFPDDNEDKIMKGLYVAEIDRAQFNKITEALTLADFKSLPNPCGPDNIDDQDARLIVTYDGGKTKNVLIYGTYETVKLRPFIKLMFDLRFNQKWKKVALKDDWVMTPNSASPPLKLLKIPVDSL
jgi:Domain of unknown function (DUF6438)